MPGGEEVFRWRGGREGRGVLTVIVLHTVRMRVTRAAPACCCHHGRSEKIIPGFAWEDEMLVKAVWYVRVWAWVRVACLSS